MRHKVIIDIQDLLVWAFATQRVESNPNADTDALTTYWAVMGLPDAHSSLIKRHARAATEPKWQIECGDVIQLSQVRMARLVYSEWVRAMVVLQQNLQGTLRQFDVRGPSHSEEPWSRRRA